MILFENYDLHNDIKIPKMGLGTFQLSGKAGIEAVKAALEIGYRLIDTAAVYKNENDIGQAIRESDVDRKEIFITTKFPADVKTYEEANEIIISALEKLGTDYIDLMLIHSPKPWADMRNGSEKTYFEENLAVWKAMEEAYEAGKLKAIGVSNFEIADIENIISNAVIKPHVNEVKVHIGHTPQELIDYCASKDIIVIGFAPNATGRMKGNEIIEQMAEKYGVSIQQLAIRYDIQLGVIPIPRSSQRDHLLQNTKVDFVISDDDMEILKKISGINSRG